MVIIKIIKQQFLLIKKYSPGWVDGWMGGWMDVKAVLRIAYSNQKSLTLNCVNPVVIRGMCII